MVSGDGGWRTADGKAAKRQSGKAAKRQRQIIKAGHGLHGWDGSEKAGRDLAAEYADDAEKSRSLVKAILICVIRVHLRLV
jgi:hypothetical protein